MEITRDTRDEALQPNSAVKNTKSTICENKFAFSTHIMAYAPQVRRQQIERFIRQP